MATVMMGCHHLHFHDRIALLDSIKSCGKEKNFRMARRIHSDIIERDLIAKDVYIATALITMYARCGVIEKAREVFDQIPVRNVVSWNAIISAYARNGFGHEALNCFVSMQNVGICPNPVSYACVLKACGILGSLKIGEDIDAEVRKQGLLQKDVVLSTALMDMYAKCGALVKARDVFERKMEISRGVTTSTMEEINVGTMEAPWPLLIAKDLTPTEKVAMIDLL